LSKSLLEKYQALEQYLEALADELSRAGAKAVRYSNSSTGNQALAGMFYDVSNDCYRLLRENALSDEDKKE